MERQAPSLSPGPDAIVTDTICLLTRDGRAGKGWEAIRPTATLLPLGTALETGRSLAVQDARPLC